MTALGVAVTAGMQLEAAPIDLREIAERRDLAKAEVNKDTRIKDLAEDEVARLRAVIDKEYKVEGDSISAYWNYYEAEKVNVRNSNEQIITRPVYASN